MTADIENRIVGIRAEQGLDGNTPFQEKNLRDFGSKSLDVFLDDANVELAITKYLARQSILEGPSPTTPGATALTLLSFSSFGLGQQGFQNLLNS